MGYAVAPRKIAVCNRPKSSVTRPTVQAVQRFLPRRRVSRIPSGPLRPCPEPILGYTRRSKDLPNFFLSEVLFAEHYNLTVTLRRDSDSLRGLLDAQA